MENKKKSFNFKKNVQGITLIALVVTIIVLLILAGIALNLTIGQNGIFSRAQTAANTWKNAETNEQLAMGELESWIGEEMGEAKEGTLAWMFEQALKDECTNSDGSCENPNHLHIGDYVNFEEQTNEINKTVKIYDTETGYNNGQVDNDDYNKRTYQSYTVDSSTNQLYWRVLGYDINKKQVKLISSTPLKTNPDGNKNDGYLYLYSAWAYKYGKDIIDNLCREIYGDIEGVVEARSVKLSDIDEIVGIKSSEDIKKYNLSGGEYEYGDTYNIKYEYSIEQYLKDPENYRNNEPEGISGIADGYKYAINASGIEDGLKTVTVNNQRIISMLFTKIENQSEGAYWLSSPGTLPNEDAIFGIGAVYEMDGVTIVGTETQFGSYDNLISIYNERFWSSTSSISRI